MEREGGGRNREERQRKRQLIVRESKELEKKERKFNCDVYNCICFTCFIKPNALFSQHLTTYTINKTVKAKVEAMRRPFTHVHQLVKT